MKYGVFSDGHLGQHKVLDGPVVGGLNRRCRLTLDCHARMVEKANQAGCELLVGAGDLFDVDNSDPWLLSATIDVLSKFRGKVYLLRGNHDCASDQPDHNALAPLGRIPQFHIIENPYTLVLPRDHLLHMVPYRPGVAAEWIREGVRELVEKTSAGSASRTLLTHAGIYDDTFPLWLKGKSAIHVDVLRDIMRDWFIHCAFSGDFHTHRRWLNFRSGPNIPNDDPAQLVVQIGALCPADFGNKAPFGGLLVVDSVTGQIEQHEIPGPRFVNMTWTGRGEEPLDIEDDWPDGHQVHVRVRAKPQHIAKATAWMVEVVEAVSKDIVAWEVEPDTTDAEEAAKEAAARPISLDMRRDLTEYVAGRPEIPERLRERVVSAILDRLRM